MEAVEGGEATFSVDLTLASVGEWFLNGQPLKASSVYVIRSDGARHTLTIRSVPASLHGAELKFVANGIESTIRMEVRGRGLAGDPWASPAGSSGRGVGQGPGASGFLEGCCCSRGRGTAVWVPG